MAKTRKVPVLPLAPYRGGAFGEPTPSVPVPKLPPAPYRGGAFGDRYRDGGLVKMTPKSKKYVIGGK